jgi:hypothetical protein
LLPIAPEASGLVVSPVSSIAGGVKLMGHAIPGVWRGDLQVWALTGF